VTLSRWDVFWRLWGALGVGVGTSGVARPPLGPAPGFFVDFWETGHSTSWLKSRLEGGIHSSRRYTVRYISSNRDVKYLVVFFVVDVKVGFSLFDCNGEDLCLP